MTNVVELFPAKKMTPPALTNLKLVEHEKTTPERCGVKRMERQKMLSKKWVERFKSYELNEFAEEEQITALVNLFNKAVAHGNIRHDEKQEIKAYLILLNDFVKYPHSLCAEYSECTWRKN